MDIFEVIKTRRSIRKYKKNLIPKEKLDKVLKAFQAAPSACNLQPYKLILVDKAELIKQLAVAAKNQESVSQAPIVLIACANPQESYGRIGDYMSSWVMDGTIALDHLTLAAAAEGLGTCWIGSFSEEMVKQILDIPQEIHVIALIPLGFPDEMPSPRTRKPLKELIAYNQWKT